MNEELKRPKVPPFDPALGGPWDGERRRPVDPGTSKRKQPARRYRQFESEPISHEQRLIEKMRGGQ